MHRTMHRTTHRTTSRTTHRVPLRIAVLALLLLVAAGLPACRSADAPRGRVLRVGVAPENPPMIFVQEGELAGVEADLARALGVRLGRRVVFTRFGADALLPALERGDVDVVMSGLSITPERARRVRFIAPYMQAGQLALIRFADLARFGRIHTIRRPGARVGFVYGTTGERFVGTDLARASSFGFDDVEAGAQAARRPHRLLRPRRADDLADRRRSRRA
jgi:ABC-type amino acid transport substrate-binding protein